MKILQIHNYYQQPGGEDTVVASEQTLLNEHVHKIKLFSVSNETIKGTWEKIKTAWHLPYSYSARRKLYQELSIFKPDIVHVHNFFPLLTPSIYSACRDACVPVVQSLYNPRLLCPAATFYRNGQVCEECLGKTPPWPSLRYACYRKSYSQTAVVAAMLTFHRLLNTWQKKVDIFIVATEFYRRKFIEGGLPSNKIIIKPHFIHPDPGLTLENNRNYTLYIGRLDPEKGVLTLLQAWQQLKNIPLKIRGDGRLLKETQDFIKKNHLESVEIVGRLSNEELITLIKGAMFLVWPSEGYYETFGLVAIEAFACGVPVIASRLGAMSELVKDGKTGLLFEPGDEKDLAMKIKFLLNNPDKCKRMGEEARREFENKYTAERNYEMLMEIYRNAIEMNK